MSAYNTLRAACAIVLTFTIAGCSTLESAADHAHGFATRHPVATAVGVAVVASAVTVALDHHHNNDHWPEREARGRPCPAGGMTECRP
jgi:hypothetical protein